jgi:hypothetical protein
VDACSASALQLTMGSAPWTPNNGSKTGGPWRRQAAELSGLEANLQMWHYKLRYRNFFPYYKKMVEWP